ncbi:hypothetical protein L228DRAFT_247553 [Xylona heveae TC161]|uniref:Uncharacterized protein n=1 Tax=Xylona heveae (strain CBS 132557 / TC161) TaxID=1328760 RepID=A0A165H7M5_XYLHT|nr:hypothetical protein L228DRAFT_247553 [Xylona heveae TC161]KZF23099.1 hypothetical protein L228DRAFT_247553 [Xylona heveae TC161]
MGGSEKPPGVEMTGAPVVSADVFDAFVHDMQAVGFWPGAAYYLNLERNAEYNGKHPGRLVLPVLFVHATWDLVCCTILSRLAEPMRKTCRNLTEEKSRLVALVHLQKPAEVNTAVMCFLEGHRLMEERASDVRDEDEDGHGHGDRGVGSWNKEVGHQRAASPLRPPIRLSVGLVWVGLCSKFPHQGGLWSGLVFKAKTNLQTGRGWFF